MLSAVTSYSTTQNKHYAQTYFLHKVWLLRFGKLEVTQAALLQLSAKSTDSLIHNLLFRSEVMTEGKLKWSHFNMREV